MTASDVPSLTFVDPDEADSTWRVVLWAPPGEGKTVGAASAPDPIVALSADRPGAYRFARRHHKGKDIRETRYETTQTFTELLGYLRANPDVRSVLIDPFGGIYDRMVDGAPKVNRGSEGLQPDYQKVNRKILDFLYALREFPVNVVIVAHEKLNDGKKGDGLMYPALGGPALINKILAESDIVARVYRERADGKPVRYMAQLQPEGLYVCKDSTPVGLGETRELDLTEWFEAAAGDDSDLPWSQPKTPAEESVQEELA